MVKGLLYFILLTLPTTVLGQSTVPGIKLLVKSKPEGVWLRWAPTDPTVWQLANKHGYRIERFALLPDGNLENPTGVAMTPTPVRPANQSESIALATSVPEAEALSEILYGTESMSGARAPILNQRAESENKFGVALLICDLSRETARAAGLFFVDQTAEKGRRYIYRVKLNFELKGFSIEPGIAVHTHGPEEPLPRHTELKGDFRDRTAALSWPTLLDKGIYTAYHIERSISGGPYERMTDLPYVHMSEKPGNETAFFVDSLRENGVEHAYRIAGVTPFGEVGPFSNEAKGRGRESLVGFLVLREIEIRENRIAFLEWEFPQPAERLIGGFRMARSPDAEGPYEDIGALLNPTVRKGMDEPKTNNSFYIVRALDNAGNELTRSFPFLAHLEDNIPPVAPAGVRATISSKGRVTIQWEQNQESDLQGYRVFRSNSANEEVVEVTRSLLSTSEFADSVELVQLNRKIYYRIAAVDQNFNVSDYSDWVWVLRPDVIPPAKPVIVSTRMADGGIRLDCTPSASIDVAVYQLVRHTIDDSVRVVLKQWPVTRQDFGFEDKQLELGKTYRFQLIAKDSAGNSASDLSGELLYETGVRPAVGELAYNVDREKKEISLKWNSSAGAVKTLVYRRINDGKFTLYQTLAGTATAFSDRQLAINNTYSYRLQLVFKSGVKSEISKVVTATY
ncbi:MAG: hypothetical protein ACK5WO_06715 [Cyclobacteriaceae bacterium]|jgi:fibronectin type 3 domain-containing protein